MIKFEKDEVVKYFDNDKEAAQWLDQEYKSGGRYAELLEEISEPFHWWVNDHWSAYDILSDPEHFTYDSMHEEWLLELAYDIRNGYVPYFSVVGGKD
jgi:hypothetical protein